MLFTEHFAILNDFPLHWDEELLQQGKHKLCYYPDKPARFAVVPRRGAPQTGVRWFEASPTYVLHWLNAWEEGDEIVMHGYHQKDAHAEGRLRQHRCDHGPRALRPHAVLLAAEPAALAKRMRSAWTTGTSNSAW